MPYTLGSGVRLENVEYFEPMPFFEFSAPLSPARERGWG